MEAADLHLWLYWFVSSGLKSHSFHLHGGGLLMLGQPPQSGQGNRWAPWTYCPLGCPLPPCYHCAQRQTELATSGEETQARLLISSMIWGSSGIKICKEDHREWSKQDGEKYEYFWSVIYCFVCVPKSWSGRVTRCWNGCWGITQHSPWHQQCRHAINHFTFYSGQSLLSGGPEH